MRLHRISKMRMPSVTSVSPVSGKLGQAPVSHTLNSYCDCRLRDQHRYLLQHCILMSLLCVGPSVQKCHKNVIIVDVSDEWTDQSMHTTLFLLILVRCVLALVLSMVFAQKRTNTTSMYSWLIKCPYITTRSVVLDYKHLHISWSWRTLMYENLCLLCKLNFAKNRVKTSQFSHWFTKLLCDLRPR